MPRWLSLVAAALATLSVQALDTQLDGIDYDLRQGPDWAGANKCKPETTIAAELKTLSTITKNVRTYSMSDCDVTPVLTNAKALGMTVWLGIWVSADDNVFQGECAVVSKLITAGMIDDTVVGFNVGSEAVYRKDITPEKAIEYLKSFQGLLSNASITKSTAITDIIDTMLAHPEIVAAGDVVTINQFPFWEKVKPSEAADQFLKRIQPLLQLAGNKQVYITETGWSSNGSNENASVASPAAAARYLNDFVMLAKAQKWKYYYFQGFDSPWKAQTPGEENTVEGSFGLYAADGTMKPEIKALKIGKKTDNAVADAGQDTKPQGGGTGGGAGGNGAVHGASGSKGGSDNVSAGSGSKGTKPSDGNGNNKTGGANRIGSTIAALLTAVLALTMFQ